VYYQIFYIILLCDTIALKCVHKEQYRLTKPNLTCLIPSTHIIHQCLTQPQAIVSDLMIGIFKSPSYH